MDAKTCLKKMQLVGVLNVATVDENGAPQIRCISAVHYDEDSFYFFTAKGKMLQESFYPTDVFRYSFIQNLRR